MGEGEEGKERRGSKERERPTFKGETGREGKERQRWKGRKDERRRRCLYNEFLAMPMWWLHQTDEYAMTQLTVFGVYTLRTRWPDSAETLSSLCILHAGKHLHQLHQLIRPSTIHSQFPPLPIHPSNQLAHVQVKASSYPVLPAKVLTFYRAMHFSAKRGIAIACRLSVCLSIYNVGGLWSHRLEFFENNFTIS